MAELIYWDSDACIGWFQEDAGKVDLCKATLDRAESGEVVIVVSALVLAETLWLRGQAPIPKDKSEVVHKFFRRSYFRAKNVTRKTAESAQKLVWEHGIKPKDAIHVATALEHGVPVLETFDAELIEKSGSVGEPPLLIRKPQPPKQGSLDLVHGPKKTS